MLLLITIGLVLIAAVTLLIGIFSNSLPLIYVSIGSSFLAAIVLVVLSQISRRGREVAPAPAPEPVTPQPVPERERVPAGVAAGATTTAPRPTATAAAFPIEGYDDLTVAEILPRLDDLNAEELDAVAEREETGKNRSSILTRIDERLDRMEEDSIEAEEEVEDERLQPATAAQGADDFPIEGYDDLSIAEILPLLDGLDAEELDIVAEREETGKNRMSVLNRIDERLDELEGVTAPSPKKAAAKKKAASKKAPAKKKAAAKRAPAKKAAATKKAATKRAPAKKKAAAKKAPAKKKAAATKKKAAKKRS